MTHVDKDSYATLEFELEWSSEVARHRERYLARKVNIWRDLFPPGLEESLVGLGIGEQVRVSYQPGEAVPAHSQKQVLELPLRRFSPRRPSSARHEPGLGRFYPKGFLEGVVGIYPANVSPFRVAELQESSFTADLNHPLARFPLELRATVLNAAQKQGDVGGRCAEWMVELGDMGPGLETRYKGRPTDFGPLEGLSRENQEQDERFYREPRLIGHVDRQASSFIKELAAEDLHSGMRVLDLMSSVQSHLPDTGDLQVTGLGMNEQEMAANPALASLTVHDLNRTPELPFDDCSFDAVFCHLSIEYLIKPESVFAEVARVLQAGGLFGVSFSNRWFPPKVTCLWTELHEFERMGLVLEYFLRSGAFQDLETVSIRNWWRPRDDRWASQLAASDPVYYVKGRKSS